MLHNALVSVSNGLLELDLRSPSIARSLARSFARSSLTRSLDRSVARTLGHSIARSLGRSVARSLSRSLGRSLARSFDRSIARSLARSLDRSIARSLVRSLDRSIALTECRLNLFTLGRDTKDFKIISWKKNVGFTQWSLSKTVLSLKRTNWTNMFLNQTNRKAFDNLLIWCSSY